MSNESLMKFLVRSLFTFALLMLAQLDSRMEARVDSDAFMKAFSYKDEAGRSRHVRPWVLGPGWRLSTAPETDDKNVEDKNNQVGCESQIMLVSQERVMAAKREKWLAYFKFYGGHIPYAVWSTTSYRLRDIVALEPDTLEKGETEVQPTSDEEEHEHWPVPIDPDCTGKNEGGLLG